MRNETLTVSSNDAQYNAHQFQFSHLFVTNNLQKIKQQNRQILKSCHRRENKMTRTNTTGSVHMIITSAKFNNTKHMRSCSEIVPPLREKISSTMLITTKTRRAVNEAVSPRFTQGSLNGLFHR